MRFKKFITEEIDIMSTEQMEKFKKDCNKFLDEIVMIMKPLYRGIKNRIDTFGIKNSYVNSGRTPMNTPVKVHQILNDLFEDEFGWSVRNGVMATGKKKEAASYGGFGNRIAYYFFPCGNYDFCWSPKIDDLYIELPPFDANDTKESIKQRTDYFILSYQDDDLKAAIESEHEISFNCEKYYLFNSEVITFEDLINEI